MWLTNPTQAIFVRIDLFCICVSCFAKVWQRWQIRSKVGRGKSHFPRSAFANAIKDEIMIRLEMIFFMILIFQFSRFWDKILFSFFYSEPFTTRVTLQITNLLEDSIEKIITWTIRYRNNLSIWYILLARKITRFRQNLQKKNESLSSRIELNE